MTKEELDFIGSMNMCDEISNEAYKKIVCHCREQEPCEDAISRQAVLDRIRESIETYHNQYTTDMLNMWGLFTQFIKEMPPVNPQPKTGHWERFGKNAWKCPNCDRGLSSREPFCPSCGERKDWNK